MLRKDWIQKHIVIHSDDWFRGRLAKFTASEWYVAMQEKPYTTGAMSYIYRKVGEEVSGIPCRDEISNESTEHGHRFEADNLRQLMRIKGLDFIVTQQLISEPGSRFGCTPDGLIIHRETSDGLGYDVSTIEAKCPKSFDGYIKLALCKNPDDVRKVAPAYFHQVLMQMDLCGALRGYLCVFHPHFRFGNTNIIEFRKIEMMEDFKLLATRKKMMLDKFDEIRDYLFNLKPE